MEKHRALIVGAGRIGAGYNWMQTPYIYTHADAYLALEDRVELCGFVEPDVERANAAEKKYGIPAVDSLDRALAEVKPDVVSICTQPNQRAVLFGKCVEAGARGVWNEKPLNWGPYMDGAQGLIPLQVNYWRRADTPHITTARRLAEGRYGAVLAMVVCAKRDTHTVCHFTDLALWWGVPKSGLHYVDITTVNYVEATYILYAEKAVISCSQGGMEFHVYEGTRESTWFPGMKIMRGDAKDLRLRQPDFMETMLGNLLDAMEGKAELLSPPGNAIRAEEWADQILKGRL